MTTLLLTRDFQRAGQQYYQDIGVVRAHVQSPEGKTFLESIPVFDPDAQTFDVIEDNCYAFAANATGNGRVQPGFFGTGVNLSNLGRPRDFERYRASLHESLLADGAVYLGESFAGCLDKGVPMAIFFRQGQNFDYDCMALRRMFDKFSGQYERLAFANKPDAFAICPEDRRSTIFSEAARRNYGVFGGYYALKNRSGPALD